MHMSIERYTFVGLPQSEGKKALTFGYRTGQSDAQVDFPIHCGEVQIGHCGLDGILYVHGRCNIVVNIWDEAHRRKGIGTKAVRLLLEYARDVLRLHRVAAQIVASNVASLGLFHKCGFQDEGRLREHQFVDGKYEDMIVLGYLLEVGA